MTTVTRPSAPAVPAGMDPDITEGPWWQDDAGRNVRFLWTPPVAEPAFLARFALSGVCSQADTGEILTGGEHTPSVFFEDHSMSIADAERVGDAFRTVADQLRAVCLIPADPDSAIAAAKAAVQRTYLACRTLPGNAGDYLRAALDSIDDAQAVAR